MAAKYCVQCRSQVGEFFKTCPYDGAELKPVPSEPSEGQLFAERYEILSVLGKGGMSTVYKARHQLMDRIVALKLLHSNMVQDEKALERFKQEAQAVSALTHPNIISVYDFGIVDEIQAYLVMDYLDGTTLAEVLEKEGAMNIDRCVRIFRQICEGLDHAHRKGVIHRDLKPSNFCLVKGEDGSEVVKIVDFGIAKMVNQDSKDQIKLTQTGQVCGSPLFMSPEQWSAKPLDARSDIYSLGCVMYQTLTGALPFNGITTFDTMTKHLNDRPEPFKKIAPEKSIPQSLEAVVFRCLEKQPDDRYQSVGDVLADLPAVERDSGSLKLKAVEHPMRTRFWFQIFRVGFFTLAILVLSAVLYESIDRGADNDRGTIFQKTLWNTETTIAQSLMNAGHYKLAASVLSAAEDQARSLFNNRSRLMTALVLEREVYKKDRQFENLEAVNKKIKTLHDEMMLDEYRSALREVDGLQNANSTVTENLNKILAEISAQRVILTARALAGFNFDLEQETLLTHAKTVYSQLLGADHPIIAEFDTCLADCYTREQRTYKVRLLLAEALQIYRKTKGENDEQTIFATMRLGQFDRDRNNFTDAKPELENALAKIRAHHKNNRYLLIQCLNSYADYLGQTGDRKNADKFFAEATALSEAP